MERNSTEEKVWGVIVILLMGFTIGFATFALMVDFILVHELEQECRIKGYWQVTEDKRIECSVVEFERIRRVE